jgi:carboxyl-terminal processing protease
MCRRRPWVALLALAASLASASDDAPSAERARLNLETFDTAWRLVDERFWDPEFGGVDWDAVREELRPEAERSSSDRELREVIGRMVARLGQSHFGVIAGSPDDGPAAGAGEGEPSCADGLPEHLLSALESSAPADAAAGPGLDVAWAEGTTLVARLDPDGPAMRAGIGLGWELLRVDGQQLADVARCLGAGLGPRALASLRHELVAAMLEGPPDSSVELALRDDRGEPRSVRLEREEPSDSQIAHFGNLPPLRVRFAQRNLVVQGPPADGLRIGVLRFDVWMIPIANLFEDAMVELQDAGGIVLDLRGNPGGIAGLAPGIAGFFMDEKLSLGTLRYRNDELRLNANPRRVTRTGQRLTPYEGPLGILVDQFTGSTSEIFAAAMQDHGRARVFGEPTAAAALPAVIERLPNGDLLMHALADFERPGGGRVEGAGVTPDQLVPVTRDGLLRGVDEPLQAAVDWVILESVRRDAEAAAAQEAAAPPGGEIR